MKLIKFWDDTEQANMPALADEIARLSKENAILRSQIQNGKAEKLIQGLTFCEMKAILTKKGLLDLVVSQRLENFGDLDFYDYKSELIELRILGLVDYIEGKRRYSFNEYGRVFLNQIELEQLGHASAEELTE